jgi:hypothetical protein
MGDQDRGSPGTLASSGLQEKKKLDDSSRFDVTEIARVA